MKKIVSVLMFIVLFSSLLAAPMGTGYGTSIDEAKRESLTELANSLKLDPQLKELIMDENIPKITIKEKKYFLRKKYRVISSFSKEYLDFYRDKLESHISTIDSLTTKADSSTSFPEKKELFSRALDEYPYMLVYNEVVDSLGGKKLTPRYSYGDIQSKLATTESILNRPRTFYITLSGDYPSEGYAYILTKGAALLDSLSKRSDTKFVIVDSDSDEVDTLYNIHVNGYYIEKADPITYNNKVITPEKYVSEVSITVTAKDKTSGNYIITETSNSSAYDFYSRRGSFYKSVDSSFKDIESSLTKPFSY